MSSSSSSDRASVSPERVASDAPLATPAVSPCIVGRRIGGLGLVLAGLTALFLCGTAYAANEGRDDLDQATQAKLNVKTLSDLVEVIRLCESSLKKGLDEDNTKFAKQLLASSLSQRGLAITRSIFSPGGPDPQWPRYREAALNDLERAVELDPNLSEAALSIAKLQLLPKGDRQKAIAALDKAGAVEAGDTSVRVEALLLRASLEKEPKKQLALLDQAIHAMPNNAAALRARCEVLLQDGQPDKALADADAALRVEPGHEETLEFKAVVLARLKKYKEADAVLAEAVKLRPKSLSPWIKRAQIAATIPDYPAAMKALDKAEAIQPGNPAVLICRAAVYQALKEDAKALAEIDKLLAANPAFGPALRLRSMLLAGMNRFDEAIAQQEEVLKGQPDDLEGRSQLAMLYSAADRPTKAVELFNEILAKEPGYWLALRGRGDAYLSLGKHAEAIADFEKVFKTNSKDSGLLNNFAWVLATSPDDKLRNGKRALEMALEACKVTEYRQAHILSTLGAAHAELGDFESAKKWAKKAIELATPDHRDPLRKELESYEAKKPVRERKNPEEGKKSGKPSGGKPAELPKNSAAQPMTRPAEKAADKSAGKPAEKPAENAGDAPAKSVPSKATPGVPVPPKPIPDVHEEKK